MRCLLRCVVATLVLGVLAASGAYFASGWLSAADAPGKADALVVLGDEPTRALEAADLYAQGVAPRVLLSSPARAPRLVALERLGVTLPWFEETATTLLTGRGVPAAAIERFGRDLKSTVAEANALRKTLPAGATVVVVTSPYHVRRTRMIMQRLLPEATVRVVGSRYEPLPDRWWTDQEAARNVILEGLKLTWYLGGGRFE